MLILADANIPPGTLNRSLVFSWESPKDKFRENTAVLSRRFRNSRFGNTSKL